MKNRRTAARADAQSGVARVPVHAHYASEGLKPERIAKPGKKLRRSVRQYDVLGYGRSEHSHAFREPYRHTAAVQRQIGGAGSFHKTIMYVPRRITKSSKALLQFA